MDHYEVELLFKERRTVGNNLYEIMKAQGYTKISFSKAVNISRPTLNHLFEGEINSITTFEKHLKKAMDLLRVRQQELVGDRKWQKTDYMIAYSNNQPAKYEAGNEEKELFDVLNSLIDLCDIYY